MANYKYLICLSLILLSVVITKNPPTVIDFYMESLCPYCKQFTNFKLKPLLKKEGNEELAQVNFFPYGNAKESKDGDSYVFTCQHGEPECRGNLIETCAIHLFDRTFANNLIICLEAKSGSDFDKLTADCLSQNQEELHQIQDCLNSEEANILQHEVAVKTANLQPPHKWVPWVVVDGTYDANITDAYDLVEYLCSKRSDRSELSICSKKTNDSELHVLKFLRNHDVCYRED